MRLVKYLGQLPGPVHSSDKLSLPYDFTKGACEMEDSDARFLLARCRGYYADITNVNTDIITLENMRASDGHAQ